MADPTRADVLAVHDLLMETLAAANDAGADFGYGVALFPRPGRFDALVFGVVTRGGESTTLTYRMLQELMEQRVWVSGRVLATLRDAKAFGPPRATPTGLLDQPVLHLTFTCAIGPHPDDADRTMPFESTIFAGELKAPVLLLLRRRPAGWPV
ncbi:MAG: hypothetical protein H6R40_749 [Gemmatimonadetes bacterium]|nr:hypothetical protein [Gemmatimonadota bacterium]